MRFTNLAQFLDLKAQAPEESKTTSLLRELRSVKKRGYYTLDEFRRACHWKSPRAKRHYEANSAEEIRRITRFTFQTRSERRRFSLLISLRGVSAPMASALLMLADPKRYGVIDIRVWKLLYRFGSVRSRPSGTGFDFKHWYRYLVLLRYHARRKNVSVRAIERTLFFHHSRYARGLLYASANTGIRRIRAHTEPRRV